MDSFGDLLCEYVAAHVAGVTLTYGTNLFSGRLTDTPDAQVAIWVGGGGLPPAVLDGDASAAALHVDDPTAQVMARAELNAYATAETLIQAVYKVLRSLNEVTLGSSSTVVKSSWPLQSPTYIGRDEVQRHLWTQNFRFAIENPNLA